MIQINPLLEGKKEAVINKENFPNLYGTHYNIFAHKRGNDYYVEMLNNDYSLLQKAIKEADINIIAYFV